MMIPVRDAWEEATYTKEAASSSSSQIDGGSIDSQALMQLNKERGKA